MIRRSFLKAAVRYVFNIKGKHFGYIPSKMDVPTFQETFPRVDDGKGGAVVLHPYLERVLGIRKLYAHKQRGGDCVSQATSLCTDITAAIQVALLNQRWNGKIATEWVHWGGRCTIGGETDIDGGTYISNAAEFINEYGVVFRRNYKEKDFRNYNYKNSDLGNIQNYPNLMRRAKKHTMGTLTKVKTWDDLRAAIRNLAPIVLGSSTGFVGAKRDKEGFAQPNEEWWHAWSIIGYKDSGRKGALLMNSWGEDWIGGPTVRRQPQGAIWVDKNVIERMIVEAYALSDYVGTLPLNIRLY